MYNIPFEITFLIPFVLHETCSLRVNEPEFNACIWLIFLSLVRLTSSLHVILLNNDEEEKIVEIHRDTINECTQRLLKQSKKNGAAM